jgi:thioredoxin 1
MKLNKLLLLSFISIIIYDCGQASSEKTTLTAFDFAAKIKELPQAIILDVRTPAEFSNGHILNAKNIDWNGNDFESKTVKLDKNNLLFVYCLSGGRSSAAAQNLRRQGFKSVFELEGGMMRWRSNNLPETKEENTKENLGMSVLEFNNALKTSKLVLVDFYATWCSPCIQMKPMLEEIAQEKRQSLDLIKIDADANKNLAKELKIEAIPMLLLYKNGKEIWRHQGLISKELLLKQIGQ